MRDKGSSMDTLNVGDQSLHRGEIRTEEQARAWVMGLVTEMLDYRQRCDIPIPDKNQHLIREQQRNMWTFLTKQGQVVGALKALKLVGMISDRGYQELMQKAVNTLIPSVVS